MRHFCRIGSVSQIPFVGRAQNDPQDSHDPCREARFIDPLRSSQCVASSVAVRAHWLGFGLTASRERQGMAFLGGLSSACAR